MLTPVAKNSEMANNIGKFTSLVMSYNQPATAGAVDCSKTCPIKKTPIPIERLSTLIASADNAINIPAGAIPTNPKIKIEMSGNGKFNNIKKLIVQAPMQI